MHIASEASQPNMRLTCELDWRALCSNYLAQSVTGRASQVETRVMRASTSISPEPRMAKAIFFLILPLLGKLVSSDTFLFRYFIFIINFDLYLYFHFLLGKLVSLNTFLFGYLLFGQVGQFKYISLSIYIYFDFDFTYFLFVIVFIES